ncbi:MAG: hypothetical protein M1823_000180 [Watsoniomyces obsoletus]|nr:MAG: hypothetical protein M1823_000180 [Watsoniomyces obsoletus]
MLPTPEEFSEAMQDLGIRREDHVVVYDSAELGLFSAPRVGWTFKAFGHDRVHVLNNFRVWVQQGYPLEKGEPGRVERTEYPVPELHEDRVAHFEGVKELVKRLKEDGMVKGKGGVQILDARSHGRFTGSEPEPRPDTPAGHIPGSINVPFMSLLDPATKALLPKEDLKRILLHQGVDPEKPIISSCATGITAAVLDAALEEAGFGTPDTRKVYDGSWVEWTQRVDRDEGLITKGEA